MFEQAIKQRDLRIQVIVWSNRMIEREVESVKIAQPDARVEALRAPVEQQWNLLLRKAAVRT